MKIAVVGARGSLGTDLCPELELSGHDVLRPTRDQLDLESVSELPGIGIELVVNCAAMSNVDACEREPERAMRVNGEGVRKLAALCKQKGAALIHVSTDYVFDGERGGALYGESDPTAPVQEYGKTKLAGERGALEAGGRVLVVRTSMLMSPRGTNFATRVLETARSGKGEVRAVKDWVGSPTATKDLARGIRELIDKQSTGVIHVVNPGACSRYEQARMILDAVGDSAAGVELIEVHSGDLDLDARRPKATPLDTSKLSSLGIELQSRQDAVAEFVRSY